MFQLAEYIPNNLRHAIENNMANFLDAHAQQTRENPLNAIVNTVALAVLASAVVHITTCILSIPVIMPALARGAYIGISSVAISSILHTLHTAMIRITARDGEASWQQFVRVYNADAG